MFLIICLLSSLDTGYPERIAAIAFFGFPRSQRGFLDLAEEFLGFSFFCESGIL